MMTRKIKRKILPCTFVVSRALPLIALAVTAGFASGALAETKLKAPSSASESSASRIKELTYSDSTVYVIRTKYGYQTNIVFDPKEEIETMSIGDRSLWQIIPTGNRLFIRPMADGLSTNMTLLTNKRSYEFDLKSVTGNSENNAYVIRFVYPESKKIAPELAESLENMPSMPASQTSSSASMANDSGYNILRLPSTSVPASAEVKAPITTPSAINYNYTYSGEDALAPLQVYDDGISTIVKYQTTPKSIPSAFVIGKDGDESPAQSVIKDSSIVIAGVAGEIALRSADGEVRIYNEVINPR